MEETEKTSLEQPQIPAKKKKGRRRNKIDLLESPIWPQVAEMLAEGVKLRVITKFVQDKGFCLNITPHNLAVSIGNNYVKKLTSEQKIRRAEALAKRSEQEMKDGTIGISQLSSKIKMRTDQLKNQISTLEEVGDDIKEIEKLEEIYLRQIFLFDETTRLMLEKDLKGINETTEPIRDQLKLIFENIDKLIAFKKDLGVFPTVKPSDQGSDNQRPNQFNLNFWSNLPPELQREGQQSFIRMMHDLIKRAREINQPVIQGEVVGAEKK